MSWTTPPTWLGWIIPLVAILTLLSAVVGWLTKKIRAQVVDVIQTEVKTLLEKNSKANDSKFETIERQLATSSQERTQLLGQVGSLANDVSYIKGRIDRRQPGYPV